VAPRVNPGVPLTPRARSELPRAQASHDGWPAKGLHQPGSGPWPCPGAGVPASVHFRSRRSFHALLPTLKPAFQRSCSKVNLAPLCDCAAIPGRGSFEFAALKKAKKSAIYRGFRPACNRAGRAGRAVGECNFSQHAEATLMNIFRKLETLAIANDRGSRS